MASDIMAAGIMATGGPLATGITGTEDIMDIGTTDIRKFMYTFITVMGGVIFITGGGAALVVGHM